MKRKENIQVKAFEEEKLIIQRNAESANLDVSKYLRTVGMSDEKVVFLDKGAYIPKNLIEINDKITCALREGKISDKLGLEIIAQIRDIMEKFVEISKQLTVVETDEEE